MPNTIESTPCAPCPAFVFPSLESIPVPLTQGTGALAQADNLQRCEHLGVQGRVASRDQGQVHGHQ